MGYWSKTITCIANTRNIDVPTFLSELEKKGFAIANGYGPLKNKTFRIGHMGDSPCRKLRNFWML